MNENIDLRDILKDVPKGTKFWCSVYGEITFDKINFSSPYPICFKDKKGDTVWFSEKGLMNNQFKGECVIFPSKEQRDWSEFEYKHEPKREKVVLHPFDKVLVRDEDTEKWKIDFFSHTLLEDAIPYRYICFSTGWEQCVPYNKNTAHLIGTTDKPDVEYEIEFLKDKEEEIEKYFSNVFKELLDAIVENSVNEDLEKEIEKYLGKPIKLS